MFGKSRSFEVRIPKQEITIVLWSDEEISPARARQFVMVLLSQMKKKPKRGQRFDALMTF